jgi:cysteine desulfurase
LRRRNRKKTRIVIYLDYNATTPLRAEALLAMEAFVQFPGNPSSPHRWGQRARVELDEVRLAVKELVGTCSGEVIFTSGGTEADNMAMASWVEEGLARGRHRVVMAPIEHPAVVESAQALERLGAQIDMAPVNSAGQVDLEALAGMLDEKVSVVALMLANNETGVMQPVREVAALAQEHGARVHCDGVQGTGKIEIDFDSLGIDSFALSGHKFGGPNGVGALVIRKGAPVKPLWGGGGQEEGRRPGTEPAALIVGMGAAARVALTHLKAEGPCSESRDRFEAGVALLEGTSVVGAAAQRLPTTSSVCFHRRRSHEVVAALDAVGVCVSGGAACHSGESAPSQTLLAMGLSAVDASGTVRFSFSPETTLEDVDVVLGRLATVLKEMDFNETGVKR